MKINIPIPLYLLAGLWLELHYTGDCGGSFLAFACYGIYQLIMKLDE